MIVEPETALPGKKEFLELGDAKALYDAIFELKVRGAPAIGICAAYSIYFSKADSGGFGREAFIRSLRRNAAYLNSSANNKQAGHFIAWKELVKANIPKLLKLFPY